MKKKQFLNLKLLIFVLPIFLLFLGNNPINASDDVDSWMPNKDFQNLVLNNMKDQKIDVDSTKDITKSKMNKLHYLRNTFRDKNGHIFHDDLLAGGNKSGIDSYSIEGIQYAKNLNELQLSSNLNYGKGAYVGDITDVSPIKDLLKLEYVSLYGNRITNIDPIINLQNNGSLKYLDIINNSISDFSKLDLSKYNNDDIPANNYDIFSYNVIHMNNPAYYDQNIVTRAVKVDKNNPNYQFDFNKFVKLPNVVNPIGVSPQNYLLLKQNKLGDRHLWPYVNGANSVQRMDGEKTGINFVNLKNQEYNPDKTITAPGFKNIKLPYKNYMIVKGGISNENFIVIPYNFVDHGTVNVHYKDIYGNKISEDEQLTGKIGSDYETHSKNIPGYYLERVEGNEKGKFTAEDIDVTYRYNIIHDNNGGNGNDNGSNGNSSNGGNTNNGGNNWNPLPKPKHFKPFAIYAMKHIYMYKNKTFKRNERIADYHNKPRIKRPMFVVYGTAVSNKQRVRYLVRDVNHHSKTYNKRGYITNNYPYTRLAYYQGMHKKFTVINPNGVNSYKNKNLTKKVKNYKQGTVLKVKKIVKYNLTTRYVLNNGRYITGNRKLVIMHNRKQVKKIKTKHSIYLYKDNELKHKIKKISKNKYINVRGFDYSKENNMKLKGTKRYRISGGYITANKKFIKVIK
ncbi:hypothetical protein GSH19_05490 [Lactobacillus sp. S2-2]|uniref:DUF5776 domain-containing protein n=1 Tax=Lactobacillus sp. S2-2 TaxID=2692917 RepID=UPI001F3F8FA9|nr:DUF5776 domain-containing protein [Lactobacillus sp. S2-2]MCF6515605.1 hypothetical protein [Lactobacillus sp. S2-2]